VGLLQVTDRLRKGPRLLVASQNEHELTALSDETLASRSNDDLDSFAELYNRYLCRIYRFLRSQTPDESTAEDLTAHTFFRAMSAAGTFRGDGAYKAWLFRIAHNTLATWRRKQSQAPLAVEELPEHADPSPSPATIAVDKDQRQVVWSLVQSLPRTQREVLALRYLEDLDIAEISAITGKTRGAIRILLHRARSGLRSALEQGGHA
jgi:RNA polymerase sigma-70 factor, ECF subfamily